MKITKVTGNDAVSSWYNTGVLCNIITGLRINVAIVIKYTYMSQMSHVIFNFKQSTSCDRKCNILYNLFYLNNNSFLKGVLIYKKVLYINTSAFVFEFVMNISYFK